MGRKYKVAILVLYFSVCSAFAQQRQAAPEGWAVPDAAIRADFDVVKQPQEPEAGILLRLPDGGFLPAPEVAADVRDSSGAPLEHRVLWRNPAEGMLIACATPPGGAGRISVYLKRGSAMAMQRRASSALRPGLLLCTKVGGASLDAAKKLAAANPPGAGTRMGQLPYLGHRENPFGPDDDYCSWYSGWFKLDERETIYFGTVSDEGSELQIDGRAIASWPGLHTRDEGAKGQYGKAISLEPGWHRIDYFHFEATGPQEMMAVWRRSGDKSELPEQIPESAFIASGDSRIASITLRDGRRAAAIGGASQAVDYLWFGDQPVHRYLLRAEIGDGARGCVFAWDFGNGRVAHGPTCEWLVAGEAPVPVTLVTSNAFGLAKTSAMVYPGSPPPGANALDPNGRLNYRRAFLQMVEATPAGREPGAEWHPDLWNLLAGVLEPYKGGPILQPVFERAGKALRAVPLDDRRILEDRYVESLRARKDPSALLAALDRLAETERDPARKFHWREERICALLFEAGDVEAARREAKAMRNSVSMPEQVDMALIRQGDAERFAGDIDAARALYATAQERSRGRVRLSTPGGPAGAGSAFASSDGSAPAPAKKNRNALVPLSQRVRIEDWKAQAVRDATFMATIRDQLAQGAVEEAMAELRRWETESPLSKLNGDYPLAEARIYSHLGDDRRAVATLRAYRATADMDSALPDAMALELECLERMRRLDDARALAKEIVERLPGHPLADKARATWLPGH